MKEMHWTKAEYDSHSPGFLNELYALMNTEQEVRKFFSKKE